MFMFRHLGSKALLFPLVCATLACTSGHQERAATDSTSTAFETASAKAGSVASTSRAAASTPDPASIPAAKVADAAAIYAREQVPVLCYHQIRPWRASDSKMAKDYIIPTDVFRAQLKMLADSGYHSITPDQLYAYLTTGAALPPKPVLFTFDDGVLDHYTEAAKELEKHGFRGAFFIMTVAIGRRGYQPYMDKQQIKELSDRGHVIGGHSWDHHNVKKYQGDDWVTQIEKPHKKLEEITGKPIRYFAYPFGLWNPQAAPELQKRGVLMAFQLAEKRNPEVPLYSVRRIIASGYWSPKTLYNNMVQSF